MDRFVTGPGQLAMGMPAAPLPEGRRHDWVQSLWRQRWLAAAPAIGMLMLAVLYILFATPKYTSRGVFSVKPAASRLSSESIDPEQYSNFLYTQRTKLLSRDILAGVLGMPANLPGVATIKDLKTFAGSESPLEDLRDTLDVEVIRKDDTIAVSYESKYPQEAQVIVNAVVENYIRWQTRPHRRSNTGEVLDAYDGERKKVEAELAGKTQQMSELEAKYGVLSSRDQDNVVFRQLATISQALETQRAQTLKDKQDFESASRAARRDERYISPGTDVLVSAEDEQLLRTQILQLQQKLTDMRQRFLPNHPAVIATQQQIDRLGVAYADALERRYLRSKALEEDLQRQFDAQNRLAVEVSGKMALYGRLEADADRLRRLIDTLETRIHSVELENAAGQVNIDFFEPASVARKSHPAPKRTLAIALLLGLAAGVGLVLGLDWIDDRLRSADEVRSALSLPLLGAVPKMAEDVGPSVSAQKVVLDPTCEVAEAYRSLRTAIHFGAPKDRSKTLLVASPAPADGKTTSAANLACVMTQAGKHVLLIDADLRNPRLHTIFGVREGRPGLSAVLREEAELDKCISPTPVSGLDLLPCGVRPDNPSELLNSPSFSEILETVADKYDHVIIDSPPVVGLADTRIIAACCDLTLLIVRAEKSTRKLSTLARDGLSAVGANILGVIINDIPPGSEGYYESGYGYGTAYGYGRGDRPAGQAPRLSIEARLPELAEQESES